jgi:hypothetical protein
MAWIRNSTFVLLFGFAQMVGALAQSDPVPVPPNCPDCTVDPCDLNPDKCADPEPAPNPNPGTPGGPAIPPEPQPSE